MPTLFVHSIFAGRNLEVSIGAGSDPLDRGEASALNAAGANKIGRGFLVTKIDYTKSRPVCMPSLLAWFSRLRREIVATRPNFRAVILAYSSLKVRPGENLVGAARRLMESILRCA